MNVDCEFGRRKRLLVLWIFCCFGRGRDLRWVGDWRDFVVVI